MLKCLKIKNKTFLLLLLLAVFPYYMAGQNNISGQLYDKDKKPIGAANVFSKINPSNGTVSSFDGVFELSLSAADTIVFSCLGYVRKEIPVSHISHPFEVTLLEKSVSVDEVVIAANPSVTKEFSIRELDRISIYMSPVSGGDPLKAISILPYSTNTSESANPEIRGSSSDCSRVVVNNVPIYSPVKNTQLNGMGNFSLLNTELIDNQLVYAGNPPLKYGNSIAGLVEIKTIKELKTPDQLKLALSLANVGLMYSNNITPNSFVQIYGNYQFSSAYLAVNNKNSDFIKDFATSDIGFNYHIKLLRHFSANIYSYAIKEKFNADNTMYNYYGNLLAESKRNFNIVNLEYQKDNLFLSFNNGTNFSQSDFKFGNFNIRQNNTQVYTSTDLKWILNTSTIQAGVSHDYSKEGYLNTLPYYNFAVFPDDSTYNFINHTHNHNVEIYMYGKWNMKKFIIGAGVRKNIPVENQKSFLSFQGNFRYNLNKSNSFILSGGKYNGYTIPNYIIESFYSVNSYQVALDYLFQSGQFNLNISLYSKKEKQPVYYPELGQEYATELKISGAEVSFDYSIDKFYISGSYAWLDSKMNKGEGWLRAYNDMDYLVKGSISYFNDKLVNTSLNVTFRPGLYYTSAVYAQYDPDAGNYKPLYGDMNSWHHNPYSSIDLTFNKIIPYKSNQIITFFTISNLLNASNHEAVIYNRDYSTKDYWLYQKRLFYFGVMITL